MNKHTLQILSKIDKESTKINISDKKLEGILDFDDFKKIEWLNCSYNKFTKNY